MTLASYIAGVSQGDLPQDSVGYQTIFAAGLTLMVITLGLNVAGHLLRKKYREVY
jgi:phosphate transport system permease protein